MDPKARHVDRSDDAATFLTRGGRLRAGRAVHGWIVTKRGRAVSSVRDAMRALEALEKAVA